jgi:hypothetical protein
LLPAGRKIKLSIGLLHQPARLRERLDEDNRVLTGPDRAGHRRDS